MENDKLNGTQDQTDKQNLNSELVEHKQIEDTPFTAVRVDEKWFLTMGKYRLTDPVKTLEEVENEAKDASWWRIMQIINILIKEHDEEKELKKQQSINFKQNN